MSTRFLILVALTALIAADASVVAQRQGGGAPRGAAGAPQPGRQGGVPPAGRQGGQARPPRDRAEVQGTAIVRGRVVAGDTGAALRGAQVRMGAAGQESRAALTDANGRFEIRDLPAGQVMLVASKSGYVTQQFGQRTPYSPATPILLRDGQELTADFVLLRGGVVTGRVFDEFGDPVASVRVAALRSEMTPAGRRMAGAGRTATTDDTGAYRLFGLAPGEYFVSATHQTPERLVGPQGAVTYVPTFFPGTTDSAAAQRLTVGSGADQHNIDFALLATPAVQVSGVVIGTTGAPIAATLSLRPAIGRGVAENRRGMSSAADGSFTLPNVPPGDYVLDVTGRARSRDVPADVAAIPIVVGGSDLAALTVTTTRGATISGVVVTEDGNRIDTTGISLSVAPLHPLPGRNTTRAQVADDGMFTLAGIAGAHVLRVERLPSGWVLKSVTANGIDITDRPLEFRGTEQVSVRVMLTDRVGTVSGTVRADVPRGAAVLIVPEDETRWLPQSRLVRLVHAGSAGEFSVQGLPRDERYVAVALDYVANGEQYDPDFLARVRPLARSVSFAQTGTVQLELPLLERP
jgi:hypothetical protein